MLQPLRRGFYGRGEVEHSPCGHNGHVCEEQARTDPPVATHVTGVIAGPMVEVALVTLTVSSNKNLPLEVPVLAPSTDVGI